MSEDFYDCPGGSGIEVLVFSDAGRVCGFARTVEGAIGAARESIDAAAYARLSTRQRASDANTVTAGSDRGRGREVDGI